MSEFFARCSRCGEYDFVQSHKCGKSWEAFCPNYGEDPEDARTVYADGEAKDAAEKFVDDHFSDWDYPQEVEVWVRENTESEWQKFTVTVEAAPVFTATKIKESEK